LDLMIFHDEFDNNVNDWLIGQNSSVLADIQEGIYHLRTKGANDGLFFVKPMPIKKGQAFQFETEVLQESGLKNMAYGLVFGVDPTQQDYYALMISSNRQYIILRMERGKFREMKRWTPSKLVNGPNKPNVLGIRRVKDKLMFYINHRLVFKNRFTGMKGNEAGIVMHGKMKLQIDYFLVRNLREGESDD
ncbi:MAG: hypothetical protein AAF206_22135, partial [Bacteroidota bacterium]